MVKDEMKWPATLCRSYKVRPNIQGIQKYQHRQEKAEVVRL